MDLRQQWHGAPLWVWVGGGTVVSGAAFLWWRKRKAANAAPGTTSATGIPPDSGSSAVPGYAGLGGPLGGSSPTGSIVGYDSNGNPVYSGPPGASVPPPAPGAPGTTGMPPGSIGSPPGPVSSGTPADTYSIGQVVNSATGEKIVGQVFSPVYGWLNDTQFGGVFGGGGGQPGKSISSRPYGGSYLGYLASRPASQRAAEQAVHGQFGANSIALTPSGGYQLTNSRGENYGF